MYIVYVFLKDIMDELPPPPRSSFTEIEQINIILDTNIQGKNGIPFTRNMLSNPEPDTTKDIDNSKLELLPFFSSNRKLPKETLSSLNYTEITQFFFDRRTFQKYMKNVPNEPTSNETDITKYNVMTMIESLLPTYPYIKHIYSSVDELPAGGLEKTEPDPGAFSGWFAPAKKEQPKHRLLMDVVSTHIPKDDARVLRNMKDVTHSKIPNTTNHPISLVMDRETYTMNEIIWLNDMLNHPKYREILDTMDNFNYWKETTAQTIDEKLVDLTSNPDKIHTTIHEMMETIIGFKNRISSSRLNDKKYGFTDKINAIHSVGNQPESSKKTIESLIIDTYQLIQLLQSKVGIQISDPTESKKFSDNRRVIEKLYIYVTIKYKYFGDSVDFSFKEDEPEVRSFFESHYQKYIEFGKQMKLFTEPYRESTNQFLQEKINAYVNGTSNELTKYIQTVDKLYISKEEVASSIEDIRKFMFVDVSKFTNLSSSNDKKPAKYEIYLMVNFNPKPSIAQKEGLDEMNDKKGNIVSRTLNCEKKNDDLVDLYHKLRNMPSTLDRKSLIIPEKPAVITTEKQIPQKKVGGKKRQKKMNITKRKSYTKLCRTRRQYHT